MADPLHPILAFGRSDAGRSADSGLAPPAGTGTYDDMPGLSPEEVRRRQKLQGLDIRAFGQAEQKRRHNEVLNKVPGAMELDPDSYASLRRMTKNVNPSTRILLGLEKADKEVRSAWIVETMKEFLKANPNTAKFLNDPENVILTYDDIPALSMVQHALEELSGSEVDSGIWENLQSTADEVGQTFKQMAIGIAGVVAHGDDEKVNLADAHDRMTEVEKEAFSVMDPREQHDFVFQTEALAAANAKKKAALDEAETLREGGKITKDEHQKRRDAIDKEYVKDLVYVNRFTIGAGPQNKEAKAWVDKHSAIVASELAEIRRRAPQEGGAFYLRRIAVATTQMIPSIAIAWVTKKPSMVLKIMWGQAFGARYDEASRRALKDGTPRANIFAEALFFAGLEAFSEKIPLGYFLSDKRGFGGLFKAMGAEALQEMFVSAVDIGFKMEILNEEMTLAEAAQELFDAGVIGAGVGGNIRGGIQAARYIGEISGLKRAGDAAEDGAVRLTNAQKAVAEAKLTARSPEKMREYLEQSTDGATQFISAEDVIDLQQSGVLTDEILADLGLNENMFETAAINGDFEISVAKLLTLDNAVFEALAPSIRATPDALSAKEATDQVAARDALIKVLVANMEAEIEADPYAARPIADAVAASLTATGQYTRGEVRDMAELADATYQTRAENLEGVSAFELFLEENVQIRGRADTQRGSATTVLSQPPFRRTPETRVEDLNDRLDAFAEEFSTIEGGRGAGTDLSRALNIATSVSLTGVGTQAGVEVDEAKVSIQWALDNGRQDIADAIVERYERSASQSHNAVPGVSPDNPKYAGIVVDLAAIADEATQRASEMREMLGPPQTPVAPQQLEEGVSFEQVDRTKLDFEDVTKSVPGLAEAAAKRQAGEITAEEYQQEIDNLKTVLPFESVPEPSTTARMRAALAGNKKDKLGKADLIPVGQRVGVRLDIPAYRDHGVWVPTIHGGVDSEGASIGSVHEAAVHITNVDLVPTGREQEKAGGVSQGDAKAPFARIDGDFQSADAEALVARAQEVLNDPEWTQVGYDPQRHSFFYDRTTGEPILSADEVIQVGPLVLARNAVKGAAEGFLFQDDTLTGEHSLASAQSALKDDPAALGLTSEQADLINPIYQPDKMPAEKLPSNREAALWLEETFPGDPITDFTEELTAEQIEGIATIMAAEAELALESTGSAFDWYSGALSRALDIVKVKYPMLASDASAKQSGFGTAANARFAFTYIMAVTSQNLDVAANTAATDAAFEKMVDRVRNGVFSMPREWGTGDKQAAMGDNFDKFGPMIAAMPGTSFSEKLAALDALFREKMTVKEWVAHMKAEGIPYNAPGQTATDAIVYGSSTLGPKIGNGFWQNLNGNFDPLTIDLWMRRTWGRMTGKSIGNPDALPGQRKRLQESIKRSRSRAQGKPDHIEAAKVHVRYLQWHIAQVEQTPISEFGTKKARTAELKKLNANLKSAKEIVPDLEGIKAPEAYKAEYNRDDVALLEYSKRVLTVWEAEYKKLSAKHKPNKVPASLQPTWAKAAKTVVTNLAKPLDQVANGTQRKQIEAAGERALGILADRGIDVTTADLQALLWYPEKDLWGALTNELETDADNIAIIPPSPLNESYDTTFARILRSQGHDVQDTQRDTERGADAGAVVGPDGRSERSQGAERAGQDRAGRTGPTLEQRGRAGGRGGQQLPAPSRAGEALEGVPEIEGATGPIPGLDAIVQKYAEDNGIRYSRQGSYVEIDEDRSVRISQAFADMENNADAPGVREAYADMIRQTLAQYAALTEAGYTFSFMDPNNDPYGGNGWNSMRDARANKHVAIYPTTAGFGTDTAFDVSSNPMLEDTGILIPDAEGNMQPALANDIFRAVHDLMGHGIEGAGFRARGEENAWQAHARLFTGPAVGAVTTETRGQNSWLNYGPHGESNRTAKLEDTVFADQKIGLMPEWAWTEGAAAPQSLEQRGGVDPAKGSFRQEQDTYGNISNIITLTENADRTTFLHELGHFWMFQMHKDLADPRLTAQGKARLERMMSNTKKWFQQNASDAWRDYNKLHQAALIDAAGDPNNASKQRKAEQMTSAMEHAKENGGAKYMAVVAQGFMDGTADFGTDLEVGFHEMWARGVEKWLGEGRSPSSGMREAMSSFSTWVIGVYKKLVTLNVNLTPEIRDVFDRLVATEEAINFEMARTLYTIPAELREQATPKELERLDRAVQEAMTEARSQMQGKVAQRLSQENSAEVRERREQLTDEFTEEVSEQPLYKVGQILATGGQNFGPLFLDRKEFVAVFGKAAAKKMPRGTFTKVKGAEMIELSLLAKLAGFSTQEAMVEDMLMPHPSLAVLVESKVDVQLAQEFGTSLGIDRVQDEAAEVVQNAKMIELMALQARLVRRLAKGPLKSIAERRAQEEGVSTTAAEDRGAVEDAERGHEAAMNLAFEAEDAVPGELAVGQTHAEKNANVAQRKAQRAAVRKVRELARSMDIKAIKEAARQITDRMKVGKMTPQKFRQTADRLAKKAQLAIARRDYTAAADLLQERTLNLEIAREVADRRAKVDRSIKRVQKILSRPDKSLKRGYDMDVIQSIRFMLEPYGLSKTGSSDMTAEQFLETMNKIDADLASKIANLVTDARRNAGPYIQETDSKDPYKAMPHSEFSVLMREVDGLLKMAKDGKTIMVDGQAVTFDQVNEEVARSTLDLAPVNAKQKGRGTDKQRNWKNSIGTIRTATRRMELWARAIDGGDDGPLQRFIVRPVMNGITAYQTARQPIMKRLLDVMRPLSDDLAKPTRIDASELDGYFFSTKAELLHFLLHTGNESNLRKLLIGGAIDIGDGRTYQWSTTTDPRDAVNTEKLDMFLERIFSDGTITTADVALLNEIWAIFEDTKTDAQAAHRSMHGHFFDEIEASPRETPLGRLTGGYVPALTDNLMNPEGVRKEAADDLSSASNAAMFPGAEDGFTKGRVEYNHPLALDLRMITMHIDRVLKFSHIGPPVRNAARIAVNKQFQATLNKFDHFAVGEIIIPWLQRSARQTVTSPGNASVDRAFNALSRNIGLQTMMGNLVNAAQQMTGLITATSRVSPKLMIKNLARFRKDGQSAREYVSSRSAFMAVRFLSSVNDMGQQVNNILLANTLLQKGKYYANLYGYFAQQMAQNLVDPVVWMAAEEQAINEGLWQRVYDDHVVLGLDVARAKADAATAMYADEIVRSTQTPLGAHDVSRIEASSSFVRIFMKFQGYFNNMMNLSATEFQVIKRDIDFKGNKPGRFFYLYLAVIMAPAVIAEGIAMAAGGDFDDLDEQDDDEIAAVFFNLFVVSQAKFVGNFIPGLGASLNFAWATQTQEHYDDRLSISPVLSIGEQAGAGVGRLVEDVVGYANEGEFERDPSSMVKDLLNAVAIIFGLPTGWFNKPLTYLMKVDEGTADPEGIGDYVQGFLRGRDGTED